MIEINSVGATLPNAFLPMGRIVAGHPMTSSVVKDDRTQQPKLDMMGNPRKSVYFGLAIPKQGEQHWNQTQWGQLIWNEAAAGFKRGEYQAPTFAWKIVDGDSRIPNKKGRIPAEQEGYAGHWVLNLSTELDPPKCYKVNTAMGGTLQELTSDKQMKRGDYGRVSIIVKANCDANGNAQSPGVYLNPVAFCVDKEGQEIVGEGSYNVDASAAFGGAVASSVQAEYNPIPTPPPSAPVTPNHTYMATPPPPSAPVTPPPPPSGERTYTLNGFGYTMQQLLDAGYSVEYIHTLP
jgi:hypothetical protein